MPLSLLDDIIKGVSLSKADSNSKLKCEITKQDDSTISSKTDLHADMISSGTLSIDRIPDIGPKIVDSSSTFDLSGAKGYKITMGKIIMYMGITDDDVDDDFYFLPSETDLNIKTIVATPANMSVDNLSDSTNNIQVNYGKKTFAINSRAYIRIRSNSAEKPATFFLLGLKPD